MADGNEGRDLMALIRQFRDSEHWAVSLARDILWLVAVVGGIALTLYLVCGTWPAVVTIESTSMVPHMNVGDLVVVVDKDRFGELQTWEEGKATGYEKFGDYGDVIIYRPNGIQDFWSTIGVLPLSNPHPIIHRAMAWVDEGQPEPFYINTNRGEVTPAEYLPLHAGNATIGGYTVLYTGTTAPSANLSTGSNDLIMTTPDGKYVIPSVYLVPGAGYIRYLNTTTHGGYITKGDNNIASDQSYLSISGAGTIEPVKEEWVVGKSLFVIPLVGLLPLHIFEVVVVMVIAMVLYELYLRRRENAAGKGSPDTRGSRKPGKKKKNR